MHKTLNQKLIKAIQTRDHDEVIAQISKMVPYAMYDPCNFSGQISPEDPSVLPHPLIAAMDVTYYTPSEDTKKRSFPILNFNVDEIVRILVSMGSDPYPQNMATTTPIEIILNKLSEFLEKLTISDFKEDLFSLSTHYFRYQTALFRMLFNSHASGDKRDYKDEAYDEFYNLIRLKSKKLKQLDNPFYKSLCDEGKRISITHVLDHFLKNYQPLPKDGAGPSAGLPVPSRSMTPMRNLRSGASNSAINGLEFGIIGGKKTLPKAKL